MYLCVRGMGFVGSILVTYGCIERTRKTPLCVYGEVHIFVHSHVIM